MRPSCLLTYLLTSLEQVCALFRNSCQLFLPARNRRPSWFSPLNQILRGVRRGGGTPKTSLVLRFPLCGQKDGFILNKPSVISDTRGFPCRLHASFTLPAPSYRGPEGGLVLINKIKKKLKHESVPEQLERKRRWLQWRSPPREEPCRCSCCLLRF